MPARSCNLSGWEGRSRVKRIRRLLSDAHAHVAWLPLWMPPTCSVRQSDETDEEELRTRIPVDRMEERDPHIERIRVEISEMIIERCNEVSQSVENCGEHIWRVSYRCVLQPITRFWYNRPIIYDCLETEAISIIVDTATKPTAITKRSWIIMFDYQQTIASFGIVSSTRF